MTILKALPVHVEVHNVEQHTDKANISVECPRCGRKFGPLKLPIVGLNAWVGGQVLVEALPNVAPDDLARLHDGYCRPPCAT